MPTYTINGKRIITQNALSEDEIDEIAAQLGGQPQAPAGPIIGSQLAAQIPTGGVTAPPATNPVPTPGQRMAQNALAGAAAVPVMAAGARALQLATQGSKAAPYAGTLAQAVIPQTGRQLAAEGAIGAAAGVAGGEFGQQAAQKFGEAARIPGEMVGGMVAGMGANTLVRNVPEMFSTGLRTAMGGESMEQVTNMLGSVRARQKLQTAIEANPALAGDLARAKEIQTRTGIQLPVKAAAAGDTTIEGLVASQVSRGENASFTALLAQQYKDAQVAEAAARKALAANPKSVDLFTEMQAAKVARENAQRELTFAEQQARRTARIQSLDERISDLSSSLANTTNQGEAVGARLRNLIDAKESQLRKEFSPIYEDFLKQAKDNKVELPSAQVAGLWQWVKTSRSEDVFADFPGLFSKINQVLSPKKTPVSGAFAEKYPNLVRTQEGTYKPMSVDDIDSLKKEINKSIRESTDSGQTRRLLELKRQFDASLDNIPDGFAQQYRDIDNLFAQKLGLPFSQNGVVRVDRAKFVEDTVPLLTEKPSAVREILSATDGSPEVLKTIEDAFMMRIASLDGVVNKNTMEINPAGLNAFLRRKKEVLDQVPGLEDRLRQLSTNVATLKDARTNLMTAQKNARVELLENVWSKAYDNPGGFRGFVQSSLKNPQELNQLIKLTNGNKVLQEGLKSTVLDIGANTPNKVQFFTDNEQTFNTLFGKEYTKQVEAIFEASQRIQDNPLRAKINQTISQQTGFQQQTGSRPEQVASEIRNPILGTFRTFGNIMSRYLQNRTTRSESEEIQAFLSNPQAVQDAAELIKELETKGTKISEKAAALIKKLGKNTASAGVFGALAPVVTGELGLSERAPVARPVEDVLEQ
jgi:hypothetical protein